MEKHKPHYGLALVKSFINQGLFSITRLASDNAARDFDFIPEEIINIILLLERDNFYKSMTSEHNYTIWQDVYHKNISSLQIAYIKLQIVKEKTVIVQFKQK